MENDVFRADPGTASVATNDRSLSESLLELSRGPCFRSHPMVSSYDNPLKRLSAEIHCRSCLHDEWNVPIEQVDTAFDRATRERQS